MIDKYRIWAGKLTDAGIDLNNSMPIEYIFYQAREKKTNLEFWQVCNAVWYMRTHKIPDRRKGGK